MPLGLAVAGGRDVGELGEVAGQVPDCVLQVLARA